MRSPRKWACWLSGALLLVGATAGASDRQSRIDSAIEAGVRFLSSQITATGRVEGEYSPGDARCLFGGKTALTVYAILAAHGEPRDPRVLKAIEWLASADLNGTYPVALRTCALAEARDPRFRERLRADTTWLLEAASADGAYTYVSQGGRDAKLYDNSSTQIAAWGVWSAASAGVEVPAAYWEKVRRHWLDQQQADGGWGYRIPPQTGRTRSYGSMTAAGLASLFACLDHLDVEQFVRCKSDTEYKPITDGLAWLAKGFTASENPGKGVEWHAYWLFCVQRVGLASGYKYLGTHDWYAEGAAELLARRQEDGSWGAGDAPERVVDTAFAVLFLVRGRDPVLINKLRYDGKWNARPRDAANLTRWLTHNLERRMSWQVVDAAGRLEDWMEAPILYVSGAGAWEPSDEETGKLREFALRGGLIVCEAACSNGAFSTDVQRLCARAFPEWPMKRLAADHPIYGLHFPAKEPLGLSGVSNGARLLVVHAPKELSLALQAGSSTAANLRTFHLLGNLYLLATDRGDLMPRGRTRWPDEPGSAPSARIRVARLKHEGNCDPEPLAWRRLGMLMGARHGVEPVVSALMDMEKLDVGEWPLAVMTGTEAFALNYEQREALADYLAGGGALIVDAAGGSKAFAASVVEQVLPLARGEPKVLPPDHAIFRFVAGGRVRYRRDYAQALGSDAGLPRIHAVQADGRAAIIFSPDDLTCGLLGYPWSQLRGYEPETACAILSGILLHLAPPAEATSRSVEGGATTRAVPPQPAADRRGAGQ